MHALEMLEDERLLEWKLDTLLHAVGWGKYVEHVVANNNELTNTNNYHLVTNYMLLILTIIQLAIHSCIIVYIYLLL